MREITFRGYSKEWGWVYGDYQEPYGIYPPQIFPRKGTVDYDEFEGIVVIHETVGQYTGLTDNNGVKIFEGDLCLCNRNINDRFDKTVFEIKYDEIIGFYGESKTENTISADEFFMCEIVGNVFDNPELLEGKQ